MKDRRPATKDDIAALRRELLALEKLMDSKFEARQLAEEKTAAATAARFESVNEFRAALSDQTREFVTRSLVDTQIGELARRVSVNENRLSSYDGRILGISAGIGLIVLIITVIGWQVMGGA